MSIITTMNTKMGNAAITTSTTTTMSTKMGNVAITTNTTMTMSTKMGNAAITTNTTTTMSTKMENAAITTTNTVIIMQMMYLQAGAWKHLKHILKKHLKISFPHLQIQLITDLYCVQKEFYRNQAAIGFTSTLLRANMR